MVKKRCPNCHKIISKLVNFESGQRRLDYFGYDDYEDTVFLPDGHINDYECPECNKVLFTDDAKARKFLW